MTIVRAFALLVGLGALVSAVARAREPGTFPLATLMERWFSRKPSLDLLFIAAAAGVATVVLVPLIGLLGGWVQITLAGPVSGRWFALAIAGAAVKTVYVLFEELIFRGALVSELRRRARPEVAIGVSALVFAAAHSGRSWIDMAILFADGVGFALAFVATRSLWAPVIWHLTKNLSVWLFLGSGTIDLTHGLFDLQYAGSEWVLGSTSSAGLADLAVTALIVGLVIWRLRRANEAADPADQADG